MHQLPFQCIRLFNHYRECPLVFVVADLTLLFSHQHLQLSYFLPDLRKVSFVDFEELLLLTTQQPINLFLEPIGVDIESSEASCNFVHLFAVLLGELGFDTSRLFLLHAQC